MKYLVATVVVFSSVVLLGCGPTEPSDYALKGAAAMSSPNLSLNIYAESPLDKLELSGKKCVIHQSGKVADCTFTLGGKKYSLQMTRTGSGWTYSESLIQKR
jgi:hypothetical protein